jgi:hypothetical protein
MDMAARQFAGVLILARLCATLLQARVNPVECDRGPWGQSYSLCGDNWLVPSTPLKIVFLSLNYLSI